MPDARRADLDAALDRLDLVFTDPPPLPEPVRGCGYCWRDGELAALGLPPGKVPEEILRQFVDEVVDHLDFDDQYPILWRRLAPRILRRIAAGEHRWSTRYGIKLGEYGAKLSTWPAPEREAVVDVLHALLAEHAGRYPHGGFSDVLDGLINASGEAASWLDRLDQVAGIESELIMFGLDFADQKLWGHGSNGPAAFSAPEEELVAEWLVGAGFGRRLEGHLAAYPDCVNARFAAAAVAELRAPEEAVEGVRWYAVEYCCVHV
ncbi:hypothetical protein AB0I28_31085 [Phytomonospora sp. NPDC050363]|uniref:hypothetical protein n=1 Tax=Phytomonospora sp. NPDC050363 TaxID=3155642 RepID=UPI0033E21745